MAVAAFIAAAVMAAGQIIQGVGESKAARTNQRLANQAADQERQRAQFEETQHRRQAERVQGAQRARFLASGVTETGSVLDVGAESAAEAELDALAIRYGGTLAAHRYRSEAAVYGHEARRALAGGFLKGGMAFASAMARSPSSAPQGGGGTNLFGAALSRRAATQSGQRMGL